MTLQAEFADFIVSEYEANPAIIEGALNTGELKAEDLLKQAVANMKLDGFPAFIKPFITDVEGKFIAMLVAKYDPPTLYKMIGDYLTAEAKQIGG